ncbi:MAG TPA: hypothetical protein VMF89_20755 [Polyangiales bacterium]|nr:hypothetical protein [Polyangiales bacterium]
MNSGQRMVCIPTHPARVVRDLPGFRTTRRRLPAGAGEPPEGCLRLIADQVARDVRNNPFRADEVTELNDARIAVLA